MAAEDDGKSNHTTTTTTTTAKTNSTLVGTARKAEDEASGGALRAKRAHSVEEDDAFARALGGVPAEEAPSTAVEAPGYGLREVRCERRLRLNLRILFLFFESLLFGFF
jgi:hypothetical protein